MKPLIYLLIILSILLLPMLVADKITDNLYNKTYTNMKYTDYLNADYYNRRNQDMEGEKKVSDFLDSKLYPYLQTNNEFPFARNYDENLQYKGVDCQFAIQNLGCNYICDEKCALYYANKNLQTFALEIDYYPNRKKKQNKETEKKLHIGWLLDNSHINNSYNFIYLDSVHNDEGDYSVDKFQTNHIEKVTCYIVRKDVLHKYLYGLGWTAEKLLEKSKQIRETNGKCEMIYPAENPINNIKFHINTNTQEKSVNILVTRKALEKLADFVYRYDFGNVTFNYVRQNTTSKFFIKK